MDRNKILEDIEEIFEICQERNIGSNETELDIRETITDYIVKKLTLTDVGSSLKILCKDLNLDPESVLLEYCNTENGFEVFYDEGIEETYLVKKGFIQL